MSYPSFALGGFAYLKEGISNTFRKQVRFRRRKKAGRRAKEQKKKRERQESRRVISHRNAKGAGGTLVLAVHRILFSLFFFSALASYSWPRVLRLFFVVV